MKMQIVLILLLTLSTLSAYEERIRSEVKIFYAPDNHSLALTAKISRPTNENLIRGGILIVHDWNGRDDYENGKAYAFAELGYIGFAGDVYGAVGTTVQENRALMEPLRSGKREKLKERLQENYEQLRALLDELPNGNDLVRLLE